MELVVITAWRRPDFLRATLERLLLADEPGIEYLVSLDRGFTRDVSDQAHWFLQRIGRRARLEVRAHRWSGNSYNTLVSFREATLRHPRPDLINLVEEDILVGKDYFAFHRAAHGLAPADVLAVSACRNQQFPLGVEPPSEESVAWLHPAYQSLGVSFRPEQLERVVRHAKPAYFANMIGYCKQQFPGSRIPAGNAEQDGLIHRIAERDGLTTMYPAVPRAYHAGFTGYNRRGAKLAGSIEQRAQQILAMTSDELNASAHSYPDHQAVPLDADRRPVTKLIEWGS